MFSKFLDYIKTFQFNTSASVDKYGVSLSISFISDKEPKLSSVDTYAVSSTRIGFNQAHSELNKTKERVK